MSPRVIEVMAWHPEVPGSDRHVGRIHAAGAPDLALINPDEWEWQDRALCAETDPEAFFIEKGGSSRPAKKVCAACPVRVQCLDFAVREGIAWGVYGGMDERQRRALGSQHMDFRPAREKEVAA